LHELRRVAKIATQGAAPWRQRGTGTGEPMPDRHSPAAPQRAAGRVRNLP